MLNLFFSFRFRHQSVALWWMLNACGFVESLFAIRELVELGGCVSCFGVLPQKVLRSPLHYQ